MVPWTSGGCGVVAEVSVKGPVGGPSVMLITTNCVVRHGWLEGWKRSCSGQPRGGDGERVACHGTGGIQSSTMGQHLERGALSGGGQGRAGELDHACTPHRIALQGLVGAVERDIPINRSQFKHSTWGQPQNLVLVPHEPLTPVEPFIGSSKTLHYHYL